MQNEVSERPKTAVIAAVQKPNVSDIEFDASVTELRALAKTLGFAVIRTFTQKRPRFDAAAYLGDGKREEMRRFINNESEPHQVSGESPTRRDAGNQGSGESPTRRDAG
ncbi:MAG: hypothetical protein ABI624_06185, partial [Casimicrobiaceae bacterium]